MLQNGEQQSCFQVSPSVTNRKYVHPPTREEQIAGEKVMPVEAEVSGVCGSSHDKYKWLTLWEKVCRRKAGRLLATESLRLLFVCASNKAWRE